MHFNPFHDPKNGQFTSGGNSGLSRIEARRLTKSLNKTDKLRGDESYRLKQLKAERNELKEKYIESSGKKKEKLSQKINKKTEEIKNSREIINRAKNDIENFLKEAENKGYIIDSYEYKRDTAEGKRILAGFLGQQYAVANDSFSKSDGVNSIAGYYAGKLFSNYLYGNPNETSVSTTKYKVRK